MSEIVIAKRYAKALLNLAQQENALEVVEKSMSELSENYQHSEDLQKVFFDTKIQKSVKEGVLAKVLETLEAPKLVQTFAFYLLAKRRIVLLPEIQIAFSSLVREKLGRLDAKVTVAQELPSSTASELEKKLSEYSGKDVRVNYINDPTILGGVVTQIGSMVIDGSLRNQLNRIHQSIIRG